MVRGEAETAGLGPGSPGPSRIAPAEAWLGIGVTVPPEAEPTSSLLTKTKE